MKFPSDIWKTTRAESNPAPAIFGDFSPPVTDENGYTSMTLWSLMSDLGPLCYCGGDVPFELKIVLEAE
jgi:repressor LexA